MTELSGKSTKNLTINELKTELTNRGLGTQGTKEVLLNRLSKDKTWTPEIIKVNPELKQMKRKETLQIQVMVTYL